MKYYPKISIVTPSFNQGSYLEKTILSIVGQSYPNLEYIIIDGGSTDGSPQIIRKYEEFLAYWVSETDNGMYHAIQKGFEMSTGEIMGWINSDDVHQPGSLFSIAQIFGDFANVNWIQGMPNIIDKNGRIVYASRDYNIDKLFFYEHMHVRTGKFIQQESTFWRRSLWLRAGGYVSMSYKYAGDFELWIRFFQHEKLYHINALLGSFRISGTQQASLGNYAQYLEESFRILSAFPLSKGEKRSITYRALFRRLESLIVSLRKYLLGNRYESAVSGRINFHNETQDFRLSK